ncbi:MAG: YihY/virulence factor BrkB family protein [Rhodobacterales bacterium]|nr:YihY/virulence factor BrkB family protein [Rhodobacterales bacterium]MDX5413478.1 YihY/virulence factor BrkB family protein [Rhodobacterales bacterium]
MADQTRRGNRSGSPMNIRKGGWWDILKRLRTRLTQNHVSIVAAGVAFFGLLAVFPAVTAVISIAGLVLDPATIETELATLADVLPEDAAEIIKSQAEKVVSGAGTGLGLAALGGILVALYSASKGTKSLMEGMNIAYDETEERGFIMLNVVALALTLFLIIGMITAIAALLVAPVLIGALGLPQQVEAVVTYGRWPMLAVSAIIGLAVVYRYGPSRRTPAWRWVSVGAVTATVLWLLGSLAFSIYVSNFGVYNETYGALAGIIILLIWLWLSGFVVLLGAELNSEIEHQTAESDG